VDRVTIRAQHAAFANFCEDRREGVSPTLDHVGQVDQLARARPIFGRGVDVIELECRRDWRVAVAERVLAPTVQFDSVNNAANILGKNTA
jgi:hypothetical protein